MKYSVPKNIPVVLHYRSYYDYYFIMKELTEELKERFTCLGKNKVKNITFTVPIEKEVARIDKNEENITNKYILQFTVY